MKDIISKYIQTKSYYKKAEQIENIAICIPIYNEYPTFLRTLTSVTRSALFAQKNVDVICCVNNKTDSPVEVKENNCRLLVELHRLQQSEFLKRNQDNYVKIIILDFSTTENQFQKQQGVGFARKVAMDYALCGGAKLIACLDADTIVDSNYISCLAKMIDKNIQAATLSFSHQINENKNIQDAINEYEEYLIKHSQKLKEVGTPFYNIALGSLIVCSSLMYAQCGGMKNRESGEDFYFIQEMIKVIINNNSKSICEPLITLPTCVHPSARISDRVIFGTGKSIDLIINNEKKFTVFPNEDYFEIKRFIDIANELIENNKSFLLSEKAKEQNIQFYPFLLKDGFFESWNKILLNIKKQDKQKVAFHILFDGLKIIRVMHYLQNK